MKAPDISDSAPVSAVMRFQLHGEMSFCPGSLGDRKHLDRDPGGAGFVRNEGSKSRKTTSEQILEDERQ